MAGPGAPQRDDAAARHAALLEELLSGWNPESTPAPLAPIAPVASHPVSSGGTLARDRAQRRAQIHADLDEARRTGPLMPQKGPMGPASIGEAPMSEDIPGMTEADARPLVDLTLAVGTGSLGEAPAFVPGMRRPGLTKASRAAIEEVRAHLQDLGLRGPIAKDELATVLKEAPIHYAHKVTKDLPVAAPLGEARRILMPGDEGYDFAPAATARLHGMADIGSALPFQANWGHMLDPEMLPAFNNDRRAADLFARFFASASPRTSVPKNALENLQVWNEYLRYPGRKFTDDRMRALGVGNVRSKTDNIIRAIIGDDPRGEKVDLFTDYLTGHARSPVPDVHGLYGIGSQHGSIDDVIPELRQLVQEHEGIPAVKGGLKNKDYVQRLVDAFGRSLQSYDPEKPMGPLFGSAWEGIRAQKGLAPQGGAIDIYRSRGATEPGALLDTRRIGQILREWQQQIRGRN